MEKEQYIDVKNYIRQKNGLYYAVMFYTNVRGERKEKWFPTKLPVKGNKTKAEAFSRKILREFHGITRIILNLGNQRIETIKQKMWIHLIL